MALRLLAAGAAVSGALLLAAPAAYAHAPTDTRPPAGSAACTALVENTTAVKDAKSKLAADQATARGATTILDQLSATTPADPATVTGVLASITDPLGVTIGGFGPATSKATDVTTQTATVNRDNTQVGTDVNDLAAARTNATNLLCTRDAGAWQPTAGHGDPCDNLELAYREQWAAAQADDHADADHKAAADARLARANTWVTDAQARVARDHATCTATPTTTTAPTSTSTAPSTVIVSPGTVNNEINNGAGAPTVDHSVTVNPLATDGSTANTSGSQVSQVPSGSVDTGEWN